MVIYFTSPTCELKNISVLILKVGGVIISCGSVENAGCGKCRVWKMRRKFQFSISISHSDAEKQLKKKEKKRDESLHFKMHRAGMVISVVVYTSLHSYYLMTLPTNGKKCY